MSFDKEMQAALITFVIESQEMLQTMEDDLISLEDLSDPGIRIAAIFRAAHTIKGSSGLFGLEHIVRFTHVVESVLDALREGHLAVSPELITLLLPCRDHIAELIDAVAQGQLDENPLQTEIGARLLKQLNTYLQLPDGAQTHQSTQVISAPPPGGESCSANWHLSLRFGADSLRNGMDPLAFIRYLTTLGEIITITTLTDAIPEAEAMNPETCYLGFEIDLNSNAGKEAIENVFEFVREDSIIHILPPHSSIEDYIQLIRNSPEGEQRLGEILINSGLLTKRELAAVLQQQRDTTTPDSPVQPIGEILVQSLTIPQPLVDAAIEKQKHIRDNKQRENQSIRVDAEKLDSLIDLVGELVISCAAANLRATQINDSVLLEANTQIMSIVEAVRDSALKLRMVPIAATFNRFQRVVRDVSAELGKDITLIINGGDTEVDKSIIEQIGDPLMHLIRNSMDHGIEAAPLRIERNKPLKGTLSLNAYHESGTIVIEVTDDGGGLNRDRILAKAMERGLVNASSHLSDKEIYNLIFEPGFSTAEQVSNLSGRGVGMDVVKQNITALRGIIDISSRPGEGTSIKIRLPLTLAIIDGFLVQVGDAFFVIPQDRIIECVELPQSTKRQHYMNLRGEVLPFIRLNTFFNFNASETQKSVTALSRTHLKRENVIVVNCAGNKTGLVVDRLLGEFQTVIKPLGKLFNHVQGIGGSTILGSGEVALIIDVPMLVAYHNEQESLRTRRITGQASA